MPVNPDAKKRKWFREKCLNGCELCGRKIPTLPNNGLQWSHIISNNDDGKDEKVNNLALCPTCSLAFDTVIKPAIFKSFNHYKVGQIPGSWENGEGRLSGKGQE
jgi:hypothetical protein